MIRFACPGCNATYSVDDSKGGKTGKCPKCQSQFVIPMPEGSAEPPPMPPSVPTPEAEAPPPPPTAPKSPPPSSAGDDPNAPIEIKPCPGCQARLSVTAADLGIDVECPYCKTVYTAVRSTGATPPPPPPSVPKVAAVSKPGKRVDDDEDERPSRRSRRDDDDDDDDDRPSRRSRRDDDDDDDDRPKKKKKKKRRSGSNVESKRTMAGILALLLGGLGVHKFYLGYTGAGIIMLFLACFGISGFIALAEGIIYLTKSDEEFIETYQNNTKEWF